MRLGSLSQVGGRSHIFLAEVALLALGLAGCSLMGPYLAGSTPTPALIPLPALQPDRGYTAALALSNANGGSSAGSFIASKPYTIRFVCEGRGNFYLSYGTVTGPVQEEMSCPTTPQLNGTQLWPATGGEVRATASANLGIPWEVLVEMQS